MKTIVVITSLLAVASAVPSVMEQWTSFKKQHGKFYESPAEENYRHSIFVKNLKMIGEHNVNHAAGIVSYSMKMNRFGDMLPEEFGARNHGFNKTGKMKSRGLLGYRFQISANVELPESFDWREEGAVTSVKDQGQCEGCWAFSTTGAMEGQLYRKTGQLVSLSEQQLIDCSGDYGNLGCKGGLMDYAFKYLEAAGGLTTEESYPFEGVDDTCRFSLQDSVYDSSVKSFIDLPQGDEETLKAAVATVGPISVGINSANAGFMFYGGGIFNGKTCQNDIDHGVLVVGYGTEDGQDYWIIKNSWNTLWGEEGFARMARNAGNICQIASMASYPVL